MKDAQATREAFFPQKEHPKHEIYSLFVGALVSCIRIRITNADPCGSGSTKLINCGFKGKIFKSNYTILKIIEKKKYYFQRFYFYIRYLCYHIINISFVNKAKIRAGPKPVWPPVFGVCC